MSVGPTLGIQDRTISLNLVLFLLQLAEAENSIFCLIAPLFPLVVGAIDFEIC